MRTDRPERWSCDDVAAWLVSIGLSNYKELLSRKHRIDGTALLLLTEYDLRNPPLSMDVLGDIKRLRLHIEQLRRKSNGHRPHNEDTGNRQQAPLSSNPELEHMIADQSTDLAYLCEFLDRPSQQVEYQREPGSPPDIRRMVESPDTPTKSFWKTVLATLYCSMSILLTSFVMVIVHDRVPDMKTYPPLPDLVLDNIPLIPWAFQVCEILACTMGLIWMLLLVFHKHRGVIYRRSCILIGTVFILRCITMLITSLSVPGVHLECASRVYGDFSAKLKQAFLIWSGMGLSIQGVRTCGDYMFSGHTVAVTLLNHFITEYTPVSWHYLHTATWVMNLFGIFFILAAHEHYSIDVFVAFYISSRLFIYYHTLAYNAQIVTQRDSRTRIYFPLFWFFESGGQVGLVSNEFEWPFPDYDTLARWFSLERARRFLTWDINIADSDTRSNRSRSSSPSPKKKIAGENKKKSNGKWKKEKAK